MKAFSSGGEKGTGVSGAAIRFTGASRSSKASSAVLALLVDAGLADRDGDPLVRHLGLDPAVEVLVLEEEDGARILDRAREQALRVLRRGGADALEAGDVRERGLRVLRVEGPAGE